MVVNALIPSLITYAIILGFDVALDASGLYKQRGLHILHLLPEQVTAVWQVLCTVLIYFAFGAWIYQDGLFGGFYLPELCALQFMTQALRRMYKILKSGTMHPDAPQS